MEPEFIAQNGDTKTQEEAREWFAEMAHAAKKEGCTFGRMSVHPTMPNLILYEGWKVAPKDQGDIRWQLTTEKAT